MSFDPLLLSRIQFAFVVFPAFTIGLAAWPETIGGMRLLPGNRYIGGCSTSG